MASAATAEPAGNANFFKLAIKELVDTRIGYLSEVLNCVWLKLDDQPTVAYYCCARLPSCRRLSAYRI